MLKKIRQEDIIAFLGNRASGKLARSVYHYLLKHPEVLDEYFPEEEWTSFTTTETRSEEWENRLWNKIKKKKKTSSLKQLSIISRAAVAILFTMVSLTVVMHYHRTATPKALVASYRQPAQKADTVMVNRTHKVWVITLEDHSQVKLYPASSLSYHRGFEHDKRDIHLVGKAVFSVAHHKRKPFTVYTKNFSTTALGTLFTIEAKAKSKISKIHLIEGKVVVRNRRHPKQIEYLLAGQTCSFCEGQNRLCKITMDKVPSKLSSPEKEKENLDEGTYEETTSDITFKNLSLPKVLTILSHIYHKTICFTEEDLKHRKFSGTIDKHQSLETTLNNLSYLNDLQIKAVDGRIQISLRKGERN